MPVTAKFSPRNNFKSPTESDRDFFMKENLRLAEENDKLKRASEEHQTDIDRLEVEVAKMKMSQQAADNDDLARAIFSGKEKEFRKSQARKSKAPPPPPVVNETNPAEEAPPEAEVVADKRKMLDDFKKPLDDTRALLSEFTEQRKVPLLLEVAQAEAMKVCSGLMVRVRVRVRRGRCVVASGSCMGYG